MMRRITLACVCCAIALTAAAEDRALLVGINDFSWERIAPLKGCENDARAIGRVITANYGIQPENMRLLLSREATTERITREFEEFLIRGTHPGDWVLFFYSGSGTQIEDQSGDETDGKDEILLGTDTQGNGPFITDDQLYALLEKLPGRTKVVLLDCAHPAEDGLLPETILLTGAQQDQQTIDGRFTSPTGLQANHGAFSYYLIEALQGKADLDNSGKVTPKEIFQYTRDALAKANLTQRPAFHCPRDLQDIPLFGARQHTIQEMTMAAKLQNAEAELAAAAARVQTAKREMEQLQQAKDQLANLRRLIRRQEDRVQTAQVELKTQQMILDELKEELAQKQAELTAISPQ